MPFVLREEVEGASFSSIAATAPQGGRHRPRRSCGIAGEESARQGDLLHRRRSDDAARGKLPDAVIATSPPGSVTVPAAIRQDGEDCHCRLQSGQAEAEHWAWRPIHPPTIPSEGGEIRSIACWRSRSAKGPDHRSARKSVCAAPAAVVRSRRLPPTAEQLDAFEKACAGAPPTRVLVEKSSTTCSLRRLQRTLGPALARPGPLRRVARP